MAAQLPPSLQTVTIVTTTYELIPFGLRKIVDSVFRVRQPVDGHDFTGFVNVHEKETKVITDSSERYFVEMPAPDANAPAPPSPSSGPSSIHGEFRAENSNQAGGYDTSSTHLIPPPPATLSDTTESTSTDSDATSDLNPFELSEAGLINDDADSVAYFADNDASQDGHRKPDTIKALSDMLAHELANFEENRDLATEALKAHNVAIVLSSTAREAIDAALAAIRTTSDSIDNTLGLGLAANLQNPAPSATTSLHDLTASARDAIRQAICAVRLSSSAVSGALAETAAHSFAENQRHNEEASYEIRAELPNRDRIAVGNNFGNFA